jgi:O-antigen ligase
MRGLLIGGAVVAVSVFPQVVKWQIDYTATSGQLIANDVLASTIFRGQQPIALFSHRGHAAIVLALTAVICAVAWKRKLISDRTSTLALFLILPALLFTNTRTAILSLILSLSYLLGRQYYKQLIPALAIGLVAISAMTFTLTSGLESGICCTSNVEPIAFVGNCCARDSKTAFLWLGF